MKKQSTIFLISIFVLGFTAMVFNNLSYANEEEWQTVGGPSISGGRAWSPSLAFDSNNIPYVAYQESGSAKATVKKFNGNTWETVGSAGFSAGAISVGHSSLQIGSDNVPYFAYTDYNSAQSDNVPYFAYTDDNNAKKVTVKKFNGVAWQTVGNAGFSSDITNGGQTNYISLAISNNIPYVVYVNDAPGGNDDDDTASVMQFNGNSWEFVGGDNFHSKGISWTFLAIDSNGIPYVAFTDTDNNYEIAVMKFICNKDIWSCSEWSTCTINGTQTRSCSMTFDCISASTPSPATTQSCTYIPSCASNDWSCTNWSSCSSSGTQTRTCNKISNCQGGVSSPATSQSCTYIPPVCTSWTYSGWSTCSASGQQIRTVSSSLPNGCAGGSPVITQSCTPTCTEDTWSCGNWGTCSRGGQQTRTCNKKSNCEGGVSSPIITQSCSYTPTCTINDWSCGSWSTCYSSSSQTRTCSKISSCLGGVSFPATTQSCTYIPVCERDLWECDSWGECSPNGIQTRSCNRTFDCSSTETAAPATSKSCEVSKPINNGAEENINREQIFKSTVKLICMIDQKWAKLGSGTIIDQYGTILTNRHVVDGTLGVCAVYFIINEDDIPFFGGMADVKRISTDSSFNGDMAILKIRNTGNKKFTAINILQSNSDNLKSGDYILPFGYPLEEDFGTTITFTEGPYSGRGTTITLSNKTYDVKGFFKTTATIDHGNSGGGAYQKKTGLFMGMPTLGVNKINYILSVNQIKKWLNSLGSSYDVTKNNFSTLKNYYSQSADIKDIDLSVIKILDSSDNTNLIDKDNSNKPNSSTNQAPANAKLKGYILLQVESHGEAWYVNPADGKRYYMKDGATAYQMMRNFGLGITNANLTKVPQEGEKNNYPSFVSSLKGKILIQTELHGEAWYVNPKTGYRHYMKDGEAAYNLMRYYSMGITNKDLEKILEGSL